MAAAGSLGPSPSRVYASRPCRVLPTRSLPPSTAGSRLGADPGPPLVSAYDGLALPADPAPTLAELGSEERQLTEAIANEAEWMTAFLERLVDQPTVLGHEGLGQAVVREALREIGFEPVDVPMDAAAAARPPARVTVRLGRRREGQRGRDVGGASGREGPFPDPERTHRRRLARADRAVGPRSVRRSRRGRLALRAGGRRHEVRAGGHARGGQGAPGARARAACAGAPPVGGRGRVHGQRCLADRARRVPSGRGRDRRALRRSHHHVAGRRPVVPRADDGAAGSRGRGRARRERDREQPQDDPGAARAGVGAERGPSAAVRRLSAPDRSERGHDPRRRLAVDGSRRVHDRVPHRAVSDDGAPGSPGSHRSDRRRGGGSRRDDVRVPARSDLPRLPRTGVRDRTRPPPRDHLGRGLRAPSRRRSGPRGHHRHHRRPRVRAAAGIPSVCFGPYAEQAHGVGERVYLPSVAQTAQVLGLFIRDWCGLS